MKIIITGGAGFIGSAVIRQYINTTEHKIVNLDALTYAGNLDSLSEVSNSSRYCFEHADICDANAVKGIFQRHQPDAVMHFAAESHVDRSIDGPVSFIDTNIVGTYHLLEIAKKYWSELPVSRKDSFRFHHISTDEVYGDLGTTAELFTEETPYRPSSPYAASKASADHLVRSWHRTYGFPILITNCSNNYGPHQFPEKLIPLIILNALHGKSLPIYGNGLQVRDWLYVDDHARALLNVLQYGRIGETYNIGGNNEKTNLEVVKTICSLLDQLAPDNHLVNGSYEGLISFVSDRPGHDLRYAIDANKIKRELGWTAIENLESGIRKTIEWYLTNESWWKRILNGSHKREFPDMGI